MEEAQEKLAEEIAAAHEILIDTAPIVKQEPVILQYSKKPEFEVRLKAFLQIPIRCLTLVCY